MLIEFLGDAKLSALGTGCRSWPVAPVSQGSFARRMRIVMPDTARWDGSQPCALARGSDRGAPALPSSAHEQWRPSVLVELRGARGGRKKLRNEPNHGAGILVVPEIEGQTNPANSSAGWTRSAPVPSPRSVRCPVLFCGVAGTDSHGRMDPPKETLMHHG
jgi:hypothetical protein